MKFISNQLLLFLTILLCESLFAQSSDLMRANDLLDKKQYAQAQSLFEQVIKNDELSLQEHEWSTYAYALCSYHLFNSDAISLLEAYISNFIGGTYENDALLSLGIIHFRENDYKRSVAKFNRVKVLDLTQNQKTLYYFRLGYSYFKTKKYDLANVAFQEIKDVEFTFSELTKYYSAHVAYMNNNYSVAINTFNELLEVPSLGTISKYYISQLYYLQGRYSELIDFTLPLLELSKNKRHQELNRLIGDAYFALEEHQLSIKYMQKYAEDTAVELSPKEKYQLASSYFQLNNFEETIGLLEDLPMNNDSLSQYCAYKLGASYLSTQQKAFAKNAFKYASSLSFDLLIQENAAFNHLKLAFELAQSYDDVIELINVFIEKFPESQHIESVKKLLVKSFLSTKDYSSAIASLESFKTLSFEHKQSLQRLYYFKAVEFYDSDKSISMDYFLKSLDYPISLDYQTKSFFWIAEIFFCMEAYEDAIKFYKKFLTSSGSFDSNLYDLSYYGLAYSYFQLEDYQKSTINFRKFIKTSTDSLKLSDAFLRTGDSFHMLKEFRKSSEYYQNALEYDLLDVDYAIHQLTKNYGLLNNIEKQKQYLELLISDFPNSNYLDDAIFVLAEILLEKGVFERSLNLFDRIINEFPNSLYVRNALLQLGLHYYNTDESAQAIEYFKKVIEQFPLSPQSREALVAFKNTAIESGNVNQYFDFVEQLSDVNVSTLAQDSISYEAAELLYLKQDFKKAKIAFDEYLNKFPTAIFMLNAYYYRAECQSDSMNIALYDYLKVLEFPNNDFTLPALVKVARYEFNQHQYGSSALHYSQLIEIIEDQELLNEAIVCLFTSFKMLDDHKSQLLYANKILALEKVDPLILAEASLFIANDFYDNSEFYKAKKAYKKVVQLQNPNYAAEAQYQLAYLSFLESDFDASERKVFELSENYFNDYYIALGFILLADIYVEKQNLFQAIATLQSVIDNYSGDDLKEIAANKRNVLQKEQDANSSVNLREDIINLLDEIDDDFYIQEDEKFIDDEE